MLYPIPQFIKEPKIITKIGICLSFLGILYYSVFKSMVYAWLHLPDFSHGFLIPFISLFLAWERSAKLYSLSLTPKNSGVVLIILGLFLLLVGNLAAESFTMRFSFLIVLSGIFLFLLGWTHLKLLLFPIVFLIFMIPIPSILMLKITLPMQLFASKVATAFLQQLGISVLREGNIIHLADTTLEVAEACSGIRSLISLLALGTIFSYFSTKILWKRIILVLSCFVIAIFVNTLRLSATVVLANTYGISVAEGFFHEFSGYMVFSVALALLVGLNFLLSKFKLQ